MKQRDERLDIAKGIALIAVMITHSGLFGINHFLESFQMPLFFIIGGYFYKKSLFRDLFKKSCKRLIKPYIFTIILLIVICLFMLCPMTALSYGLSVLFPDGIRPYSFNGGWPCSGALWFLPALLWCRIIFNCLLNLLNFVPYGFGYLVVSLLITGVAAVSGQYINLPFGILIGCSGLFFYAVGYFIRTFKFFDKQFHWWYVVFIPFWIVVEYKTAFAMFGFIYDIYYPINLIIAVVATWFIVKMSSGLNVVGGENFLTL